MDIFGTIPRQMRLAGYFGSLRVAKKRQYSVLMHGYPLKRAALGAATTTTEMDVQQQYSTDSYETVTTSNASLGRYNFYSISADNDSKEKKQPTRGSRWHASTRVSNHGAQDVIAIPENPVGLANPDLLLGGAEEEDVEVIEGSGIPRFSSDIFSGINGTIVYAQEGIKEVKLPCVVKMKLDDENVSWIRMRDHHLITVGRQTYSSDQRFSVTYNRHLLQWSLHLRYPQKRDGGNYICQLSSHPPMALVTNLTITDAESSILGGPEMHVQKGSLVKLICEVRLNYQPPEYVFWYHNGTMINFDTYRQVVVTKKKNGSILTIESVSKTDSGNFTCQPSNARNSTIFLHIIHGDGPSAMQVSRGAESVTWNATLLVTSIIISLLFLFCEDIYPPSHISRILLLWKGCLHPAPRKMQRLKHLTTNHLITIYN
ncbi:unnamed protein product [Meganyctiphanes norvegica]|uniref:Ig-like domain-containing protein n=1 Tax=Meganyctiphanes norvegica TaxID=48144 RepID=A0AAV2QXA0_MEGNR